jgi:hypothetical protein
MLSPAETSQFQKYIEGPLSSLLQQYYPEYKTTYDRFRKHIGPQCGYCKAAARTMYSFEVKRTGEDFINRLKTGDWNGYI